MRDVAAVTVADVMTRTPRTVRPDAARHRLRGDDGGARRRSRSSLVVDDDGRLVGALHLHDLFRAQNRLMTRPMR